MSQVRVSLNIDKLHLVAIRAPTHSIFFQFPVRYLRVLKIGAREIRPTIGGIVRERAGRKLNTILIRTRDPDTYLHASERRIDPIDIHGPSRG